MGGLRALVAASIVGLDAWAGAPREPVVGLPCDGCEAVFDGLPADVPSIARIAPPGEPGQPLRIDGRVLDAEGRPVAGVIVYAYQTDAGGIYPRAGGLQGAAARHGRLRGWARSDSEGRYRFDTIRPGGYPNSDIPAHVHMHVLEVGRCTYYIDDVLFEDDPRLTPARRRALDQGRGGPGVVTPRAVAAGGFAVVRDIRLGERVPGYPPRGR